LQFLIDMLRDYQLAIGIPKFATGKSASKFRRTIEFILNGIARFLLT